MYTTQEEKATNHLALEQVKTETRQNDDDDNGGGVGLYNVNRNDARLDGIERMMAEQNRMLSEILELLLVQHHEVHKEKSMPSRLKKTSFASINNDENTDTRREERIVDAKRKPSSSSSSLRKHVIAKQQQQIRGDSLQERKAKFALKTVRVEDDKKGLRSSTALAVEAARRNMMSRQTAAKLQEEESDGNNNSVASWVVTILIVLAGIGAFGLGIVAVLVKDTNTSESLDSNMSPGGEL